MRTPWISSFLFAFFLTLSSSLSSISAQPQYFHTTPNHSTTWTNHESSIPTTNLTDGSRIRLILQDSYPKFSCGFFCNGTCTSYLFAIVIDLYREVVVWSANRDNPVREGATLNLTAAGDLVLHDDNGSIVWTTNTTGKSIAGMNLTDNGNLILFDVHNSTVWESFDHPTDCLVAGQKLFPGQKLIPSVSSTNWTAQKDLYSLQLTNEGLFAYVQSNPPQVYYRYLDYTPPAYVEFMNGSLSYFHNFSEPHYPDTPGYPVPMISDILPAYPLETYECMKLMPDGQLKAFGSWREGDLLIGPPGECLHPFDCGRNAICSAGKQCSCPGTEHFRVVDDRQPRKGCSPVTPLTCNDTQGQNFIELENVDYFINTANMREVNVETCKQACLRNCSCKATVFAYGSNSSSGNCHFLFELFTMTSADSDFNNAAYIKVQIGSSNPRTNKSQSLGPLQKKYQVGKIIGSAVGSFMLLIIVVIGFTMFIFKKQKMKSQSKEEYLDQVPGLPTRFSYIQLKTATANFSLKLGEGGFGSVYQGTLEDGSSIAVKCLDGLVHVKKSFLAEVESIGSIHHVNLVRLRGFSAWKSERLLVYEFMSNGSLDQWIYFKDRKRRRKRKHILGWECRKRIILDIAKGLAYLHEECRQKIIHLDIKPQNILLDNDFNAKVSDFGLSKLIDKDQSQVRTTMRGTPGYMAPEWLSSIITEKVDVYSFGIVLLEILCGRKNLDRSQPEESQHLLCVFQGVWEQGSLLDIVDRSEDMQVHATEVVEMMKLVSWCLQTDFTRRPSMSSIVKVLEGVISVEPNLDYNFLFPKMQKITNEHEKSSKPVLPSILSGPR